MAATETDKMLKQQLENIADDVKVIREIIGGNGDPSKGLIVRMDRIEQIEANRKWLTRATLGASITALIGVFAKMFTHS